jgi:uncharacterized protein YjbI with pentapeptide repeats
MRKEKDITMAVHTHKRIFVFLFILFVVGLMLSAIWFIPRSPVWPVAVARLVNENPLLVAVLIAILGGLLLWLLLWKLPQRQVMYVFNMKDRIDLELKSRQTSIQVVGLIGGLVGGAALLGGLYFTAQTLRTSQETLQVNQETLQVNQETLRTTQQGQITERFTKAIEQLGNKELLMVRLGGIYALERIARDSESDHWAVMEVLTAFVREQAPAKTLPPDKTSGERETQESPPERKLRSDIQAILTVIGRRTRTFGKGETQRLDLHSTNLQGANLEKAQLQGASLWGAQLQDASLADAQLQGANLEKAQLQGTNLTSTQLQDASLADAQLQGANLEKTQLQGASLWGAQLQGASLRGTQLQGAYLVSAQLQNAFFWGAQLQGAFLRGAQLQTALLWGTQLQGANLEKAQLQGASLWGAQLQYAGLEKAQFQGADLELVKNLTQDQIDRACIDEHTQLPQGLTRPAPCYTQP